MKNQSEKIEAFAAGLEEVKAAQVNKDKKEKLEALGKPGLTFEDYTGPKPDGDAELIAQKEKIAELKGHYEELQTAVVKAFLQELNVAKAAAELLKKQKLAYR